MTVNASTDAAVIRRERFTLIAAILASGMVSIDGSALNFVQLAIQRDFNADFSAIAWVINGYALVLAALILVGGALADLYGRRRMFMIGVGVFAASSLACAFAPSVEWLTLARIVQGVGGALVIPGSLANITAVFPEAKRAGAIGVWSTFSTLMVIAGPVIGGQFGGIGFWRGIFLINVPIALITLYLLSKTPETRAAGANPPDVIGALLATLGLGSLTFGLTEAGLLGLGNPLVVGTIGLGTAALAAFLFTETRVSHPMMPLSLFRNRVFAGTNLLTFLLYSGLGVIPVFMPLNLIAVQGYPSQLAAFVPLPMILTLALFSRYAGAIVGRFGYRLPLIVGPFISGVGFFLYGVPGLTAGPADYFTSYFPGILTLGIGLGITVAPLTATVMASAPAGMAGTASGVNNAVARTANVLAIAVATAVSIALFTTGVSRIAAEFALEPAAAAALMAEAPRLADAQVPDAVPDAQREAVFDALHAEFLVAFRAITWGLAVLAWLSALAAFVFVRGPQVERPPSPQPVGAVAAVE
jgi:EmrB/QacA subfamily drug resistance transporter